MHAKFADYLFQNFVFELDRPLRAAENFIFERFKLFGDIAFVVDERLFADIASGDLVGIALVDFDIITEHLIESDFEILNARLLALARFDIGEPCRAFAACAAVFVKLRGKSVPDKAAVFDRARTIFGDG